ncbi:hypothetical protein EB796_012004 [Bugula neritina]|uniref:Hemicentin-1 n=1 Tax=Bugula neritina TaxID=10212 RepID=A0A7J7JUP7_BUGNE|nr:hypothetical protein EB796_012004 [Bugula neritina]
MSKPLFYISVNGGWGPWTSYSDCSEPCGGGTKTRTRTCNKPIPRSNGLDCEGNSVDAQPCNVDPCAVDGGWTPWQDWSACSGTCGNGMKSRTRECSDPAPAHGGAPCVGNSTKEIACSHSTPCPVDGGWSLWYEWSSCGITCGTGTRHRRRKCVAPKPRHGGADCPGNSTDVTLCYHSIPCPIDGQWTDWEPWAQCLAPPCTGEVGYTTRKRTCKNPQPRFNGNPCEGNSIETQQCLNNENCPVHGGWCAWGNYSNCRPSNIGRFKLRMRDCACPTPESGGNPCTGVDYEVVKCVGVNRFGIPCPDSRTFGYTDDELNEVNQESSGFYDEFEC